MKWISLGDNPPYKQLEEELAWWRSGCRRWRGALPGSMRPSAKKSKRFFAQSYLIDRSRMKSGDELREL